MKDGVANSGNREGGEEREAGGGGYGFRARTGDLMSDCNEVGGTSSDYG